MKRRALTGLGLLLALGVLAPAWADAVDTLRDFVREVKSGRASFTQTVTSADGARKKSSSGQFEFLRPNRFRFSYAKPFEQLIVADGSLVWIHDTDLNQVSSRPVAQALGATPAALLTGGDIDRDFVLSALPSAEGLVWVQATPRTKDGPFQSLKLGFRGRDLAAVDIVDAFGQRSLLQFTRFEANVSLQPEAFRFTPPPGADVIRQ
ncbi:outer membrane lipoprotein chaperone LolA [Rubrivivax rivuli]|uniref:Outer-membrane lipoprotein carrier protein n=1 Tax=Rubrivivax rivuli TaxID=1862385 RepID=A0A437RI08_9BURK|nr:outer membrane lipoprotein chaperone LolA [Rubrivivax rivuli]RVU46412.1 outer membrane lipoprotein carrier protein LolA [Rubrivivax rivuli]